MIAAAGMLAQADSAQAVAGVYSVSLLATVPIAAAAGVVFALRRSSAEARVLVWRSAIAALMLVVIGRALPLHWVAWVMPTTLAAPLVALGRVGIGADSVGIGAGGAPAALGGLTVVNLLLAVYVAGVVVVVLPPAVALMRLRGVVRRGRRIDADDGWRPLLDAARASALGARSRRAVRIYLSRETAVPMTWGSARPVIVLPESVLQWSAARRRMTLVGRLVAGTPLSRRLRAGLRRSRHRVGRAAQRLRRVARRRR